MVKEQYVYYLPRDKSDVKMLNGNGLLFILHCLGNNV